MRADELTDDALTGDFRIWQRRGGHRYSLDDVLTADEAVRARPGARRVLDLGTGIGSVLLMVAWRLPEASLVGVEAQAGSFALAGRNLERNAMGDRAAVVHGDLRDAALQTGLAGGPFDLVTGTPPYFPPGTATPSPDAQRAHARHELRGGVEDYLEAARRVVGPGGRVVVCAAAARPSRVLDTAGRVGLVPLRRVDAVPRAGRGASPGVETGAAGGALFSVWTLGRAADVPGARLEVAPPFVARDAQGRRTRAYLDLRAGFGLVPLRP
jgi:tRNA1Val (adenine37-N6)-methyltransferase